jgi:serine/threonine protein kinase
MSLVEIRRDPVEEIAEEFAARLRRGERPALTEYTDRYPELADEIRELFPAMVVMEKFGSIAGPITGPRAPAPATDSAGQLGDFRILREVGRGGMGIVYEAIQESLGRHVALKVLAGPRANGPFLERFHREAKAAARLHHTNIVPVFGVGEAGGTHFYAMQFIRGHGLDLVLAEVRRMRGCHDANATHDRTAAVAAFAVRNLLTGARNPASVTDVWKDHPTTDLDTAVSGPAADRPRINLSEVSLAGQSEQRYFREAARLCVQAADGLHYAHGQGVLHRDIKPSNLLLDAQGTVWITDFGLAKADDSHDLTGSGDIVGTVRYMAPERFRGEADARSDVYALGITLYELLTLKPAYDDSDRLRLVDRVAKESPPPPRSIDPRIPRDLETIVLKSVARDPADRYATAGALAEDLRRFLADRSILARRHSQAEQAWRWCRRNPAIATLGVAVAACLVAVAVVSSVASWNLGRALQKTQAAELEGRGKPA